MSKAAAASLLLLLFATAAPAQSRRREPAVPADAASVESIVAAYYAAIGHAPDAAPDFERLRGIFLYVGMIIPPKKPGEDFAVGDVDQFEERSAKAAAAEKQKGQVRGRIEREIARRTDCFGNLCQVFSTFEARHTASDAAPFERGVRSFQLLRDGKRWWIASDSWEIETSDNPIPAAYLPASR